VTQNFVGCLKNVYINEVSVLYEMSKGSSAVTYNGGGSTQPLLACKEVVNIPMSFPTAASMLTLDVNVSMKNDFDIEFDFKTVRKEAMILYLSIQDTDTAFEYNFGYIEVCTRTRMQSEHSIIKYIFYDASFLCPHHMYCNVFPI